LSLVLVLSSLLLLGSSPAPALASPGRADLSAALRAVLDSGAPGAIALVRNTARVRRAAAGTADLANGRPMSVGDHVRIGSITKTFVAVVALQLVAERRLRLDDRVSTWLPGVLPYGNTVTVRELLNHTSGVPEYTGVLLQIIATQPGTPWLAHRTPEELVALVSHQPPLFPAGMGWTYSNTDYLLVGMIIERITSRTLAAQVKRRILDPLGLRETSFPADTPTLPAPAARGYLPGTDNTPLDVTEFNPTIYWAAGAMISTVDDLARFYRALLTGALLPAAQRRQMLTYVDAGGFGYGLGIFVLDTPCGPAIGHNGAVPGFIADVFTSPDGNRQVVLSSNLFAATTLAAQESLIARLFCR
jgi:D-alanyl-D-alanine carboxypeptidase